MIATPAIRALIRDNKTFRITSDIQTGAKWGMRTLDTHLMELYERGAISYEEAITSAQDTEAMVEHHAETKFPPVRGMAPTPDPMANPFPMAAVVFPTESSLSVISLTESGSSAISAIPPALSAIGP